MKTTNSQKLVAAITASVLLSLAQSQAQIVNGGFETGDTTGWTVLQGTTAGSGSFIPGGGSPLVLVTSPGYTDPVGATVFDDAIFGNNTVRINDQSGNWDATQISQAYTVGAGESLLSFAWGAVLDDPGHSVTDQPFFHINVTQNATVIYDVFKYSGVGPGWNSVGTFWYNLQSVTLTGLTPGDAMVVTMTAGDCNLGGHGGYAYLDGFGATEVNVPDGGSSALMLGLGLAGVGFLRRRLS